MARFTLGFALGLAMAIHCGAAISSDSESVARLALAGGVLAHFSPAVFPLVALLWALYFRLIPDIESRGFRIMAVSTVIVLHLLTAAWVLETELKSWFAMQPLSGFVLGAFLTLLYVSFKPPKLSQTVTPFRV